MRGTSILDMIANGVNRFCGSMYVFIFITVGIVVWLFLGNIVGFDKTPWPLLLVILNLPQLSIMISLQVSANRSQAASDRRAIADHETLIALHEMAKQQLDILNGQDRVLAILDNFASKDMPGRQRNPGLRGPDPGQVNAEPAPADRAAWTGPGWRRSATASSRSRSPCSRSTSPWPGPGTATLLHQLGSWPAFAAYLISFFMIGIIWVNHHVLVRCSRWWTGRCCSSTWSCCCSWC